MAKKIQTGTWHCKDKKIKYSSKTIVMGILNVTPDSFSDGGRFIDCEKAVSHAFEMKNQGADIIDIGAQSTRPGFEEVPPEEEWQRLEGVLAALKGKIGVPVSVDTYFPSVAEKAVQAGADIINDVSGVFNPDIAKIVKETGCGWIIMHNGEGNGDILHEVSSFFDEMVQKATEFGIKRESICLDMGIGFGKTYEQNLSLISNISAYKKAGMPLLLGASRKRVIGAGSAQANPAQRVFGNIAADCAAILGGADIIRIHDVENEIQGIKMADELKRVHL